MVAMSSIPTFRANMLPLTQRFGNCYPTFRTSLASAAWIDPLKIDSTLPTHPFEQKQKCSKRSIDAFRSQHSSVESNRVEVFSKDSLCPFAKVMGSAKMKILASIPDMVMQSGYFDLCFFPVFRTFLLSCGSALQQFQLALERFEETRTFNCGAIRSSQEFFNSEVNPDSTSVSWHIGNRHITRNSDNNIPFSISASRDNPHLLNCKPLWDWAMQVNWHCPNLGKFDPPSGSLIKGGGGGLLDYS